MLTRSEAYAIEERYRRYEKAREQFDPKRFKRGGGYSPEDVRAIEGMAGTSKPTNEELGRLEVYRWNVAPPDRYFAYYDKEFTKVKTWMGDTLGEIVHRGPIVQRMGGRTQSIRVRGTNGVTYHGICNLSSGDYCRLKRMKG